MSRHVRQPRVDEIADRRIESGKAEIQPGPELPCRRWEEGTGFVGTVEAQTFHVAHAGIPLAVFFTCRDEEIERQCGKTPVFVACEFHSGSRMPTDAYATREDAQNNLKRFLTGLELEQRQGGARALKALGKQRRGGKP